MRKSSQSKEVRTDTRGTDENDASGFCEFHSIGMRGAGGGCLDRKRWV